MPTLKTLLADRGGSISITFALGLIALLGMVGVAIDYGRATVMRSGLQARTDAAALNAANASLTPQNVQTFVASFFPADAQGSTLVNASIDKGEVTVTATKHVQTQVTTVLGIKEIAIGAKATAVQTAGPPICILGLSHTASPAVSFSGNTSLSAKGCAVYSNSAAANGMSIQGSANAEASAFCAVGGASGTFKPSAKTGCPVKEDPFAGLAAPATAGCDYSSSTATSVGPNSTKSFSPGTYCATLEIKGTANLAPGVYVLKNGLNIAAQGAATGTGITFYLTGASAGFTINGGGSVQLSAPTSGTYAGVLIYQDPNANPGATNKLNGDSNTFLKGAIYTPTQKLDVSGNGTFGDQSSFMPMIADQVSFSGSSTIQSDLKTMQSAKPLATVTSGARLTH